MKKVKFGDAWERVVTPAEFGLDKALNVLRDETLAVVGYGVQGRGQALNLRDGGFAVVVGQRSGTASYERALSDGFVPGETLLGIEEACRQATVVMFLLSDAGQISQWPKVAAQLSKGDCLYFSHGFGVTFADETNIRVPAGVDVVMVAPKGSGTSLRRNYCAGKKINCSFAVHSDASGRAEERAIAVGMGIGAGYLFETDFKREVFSDLTGERGVLMGALAGLIEAQYELLRDRGHSPSEAYNETVEELTESLMPLVSERGMAWMFANTSTTAQRGALDWRVRFRDNSKALFEELYEEVATGREARRVIAAGSCVDYRERLDAELEELQNSELWRVGEQVRALRDGGI